MNTTKIEQQNDKVIFKLNQEMELLEIIFSCPSCLKKWKSLKEEQQENNKISKCPVCLRQCLVRREPVKTREGIKEIRECEYCGNREEEI